MAAENADSRHHVVEPSFAKLAFDEQSGRFGRDTQRFARDQDARKRLRALWIPEWAARPDSHAETLTAKPIAGAQIRDEVTGDGFVDLNEIRSNERTTPVAQSASECMTVGGYLPTRKRFASLVGHSLQRIGAGLAFDAGYWRFARRRRGAATAR